ncbi:MAG: hypothetical protein K0S11_951 [Gammaproteobacteria bacterium]|nr:hypothetical protein [Gammaproteobacteria bacterium]
MFRATIKKGSTMKGLLNNITQREIHFEKTLPITGRDNKLQGILITVGKDDKLNAKRQDFLEIIAKNGLRTSIGYLLLDVTQTVITIPDKNNRRKVVGDPHIAGALFTPNMEIIEGTGVDKVFTGKKHLNQDTGIEEGGSLHRQNYKADALFKKDPVIERYLFRSIDNGVSKGGGKRYIGIIALESTNLDVKSVQQRIAHDKQEDKNYDRLQNSCGHHAERAFIGSQVGGENLETQDAFMNIMMDVTKNNNFEKIASDLGLSKSAVVRGKEYHNSFQEKNEAIPSNGLIM